VSNFTYRNIIILMETIKNLYKILLDTPVCRQSISDSWLGNLRECLAHLVEGSGCDCLLMQAAPPLQFRNRRSAVSTNPSRSRSTAACSAYSRAAIC
jgi:hypothetical protein